MFPLRPRKVWPLLVGGEDLGGSEQKREVTRVSAPVRLSLTPQGIPLRNYSRRISI